MKKQSKTYSITESNIIKLEMISKILGKSRSTLLNEILDKNLIIDPILAKKEIEKIEQEIKKQTDIIDKKIPVITKSVPIDFVKFKKQIERSNSTIPEIKKLIEKSTGIIPEIKEIEPELSQGVINEITKFYQGFNGADKLIADAISGAREKLKNKREKITDEQIETENYK